MSIHSLIRKNDFALFQRQGSRSTSKATKKLSVLKSDFSLFSQLCIANQHRDGGLDEFFKYENLPFPPSLSEYGKMCFSKKSDLLVCLEPSGLSLDLPTTHDVKVFDGTALGQALPLGTSGTFSVYILRKCSFVFRKPTAELSQSGCCMGQLLSRQCKGSHSSADNTKLPCD